MPSNQTDIELVKRECHAMAHLLARLQQEELDLRSQNFILAREIVNLGYQSKVSNDESIMDSKKS